jgi:hypothetical protein
MRTLMIGCLLLAGCDVAPASAPPREVLALKTLDRVTFINDSADPIENCRVTIEGDFTADLDRIPAHGRAAIDRQQFTGGTARDEWYPRVLRQLDLRCLDDHDRTAPVHIK